MKWKYSSNVAKTVALAGGTLDVAVTATLNILDGLSNGASVEMQLTYDFKLGRVVVSEILIRRNGEGSELTTSLLHEIHVTNALQQTVLANMIKVVTPPAGTLVPASEMLDSYPPAQGRDRDQVRRDAATIYEIATIANLPPLKTVAEQLGITHRTATRRVAEAREAGLLDRPEFMEESKGFTVAEVKARLALPREPTSG